MVFYAALVYFRISPLYTLALPLATLFCSRVALDSMLPSLVGRGIPWKDRRYRPPLHHAGEKPG